MASTKVARPNKNRHLARLVTGEKAPCAFCNRQIDDEITYGKLYAIGDIQCHYFCVLLSCCLIQKGKDDEGLFGFLYPDILAEIERSKKHRCSYCGKGGATLGCAVSQCRKQFHMPCGREKNAVSLFYGNYKSYCQQHAPKQKIPDHIMAAARVRMRQTDKRAKGGLADGGKEGSTLAETVCVICYEAVEGYPTVQTFWPPCCGRDAWFHRSCLQRMSLSAGLHYLKCPLCNDKENFYEALVDQGYYVPDRDAAWELDQNAFAEIYERPLSCGAAQCLCPKGRDFDSDSGMWDIKLCILCGTSGMHAHCLLSPAGSDVTCAGPGVTNEGSSVTNEGSGVTDEDSGVTDEGSGATDEGSGVTDEGPGVNNEVSSVTDVGKVVMDESSGETNENIAVTNKGSVMNEGTGVTYEGTDVTSNGTGVTSDGTGVMNEGTGGVTNERINEDTNVTNTGTDVTSNGTGAVNEGSSTPSERTLINEGALVTNIGTGVTSNGTSVTRERTSINEDKNMTNQGPRVTNEGRVTNAGTSVINISSVTTVSAYVETRVTNSSANIDGIIVNVNVRAMEGVNVTERDEGVCVTRYVCVTCRPAAPANLDQLAKNLETVILQEQAQAESTRRGPIMPSRMSLRRTKGRINYNQQPLPSSSRTDINTSNSRLELNLKTPRRLVEQTTLSCTNQKTLTDTESPKKSFNTFMDTSPKKLDITSIKSDVSPRKSDISSRKTPRKNFMDSGFLSPLKLLEKGLNEKMDRISVQDFQIESEMIVARARQMLKRPGPLSVKKMIVSEILESIFDDSFKEARKVKDPIREWSSPKKSLKEEIQKEKDEDFNGDFESDIKSQNKENCNEEFENHLTSRRVKRKSSNSDKEDFRGFVNQDLNLSEIKRKYSRSLERESCTEEFENQSLKTPRSTRKDTRSLERESSKNDEESDSRIKRLRSSRSTSKALEKENSVKAKDGGSLEKDGFKRDDEDFENRSLKTPRRNKRDSKEFGEENSTNGVSLDNDTKKHEENFENRSLKTPRRKRKHSKTLQKDIKEGTDNRSSEKENSKEDIGELENLKEKIPRRKGKDTGVLEKEDSNIPIDDVSSENEKSKREFEYRSEKKEDSESPSSILKFGSGMKDDSCCSAFQLLPNFIADNNDNSMDLFETPKKTKKLNESDNKDVIKKEKVDDKNLELICSPQKLNIPIIPRKEALQFDDYNQLWAGKLKLDVESFQKQYLNEVNRDFKCEFSHKHLANPPSPSKLKTAIDFAVNATKKKDNKKKMRKKKRKQKNKDHIKQGKTDLKFVYKQNDEQNVEIVCSEQNTDKKIDFSVNNRKKKNKSHEKIKVKIRWREKKLKLKITKTKNKPPVEDESKSNQYILDYALDGTKKPEKDVTPKKRKK